MVVSSVAEECACVIICVGVGFRNELEEVAEEHVP